MTAGQIPSLLRTSLPICTPLMSWLLLNCCCQTLPVQRTRDQLGHGEHAVRELHEDVVLGRVQRGLVEVGELEVLAPRLEDLQSI